MKIKSWESKILKLVICLALLVCLAMSVTGCGKLSTIFGGDKDDDNKDDDKIVLIKDSVTTFNVILSSTQGQLVTKAAIGFVDRLRELGVDVNSVMPDDAVESVYDYEVVIGTDVLNRPEDCVFSASALGNNGYIIKAVGKRIIIAGGNATKTCEALEIFVSQCMGISEETTSLTDLSVQADLLIEGKTQYDISSIKLGSSDISTYKIVCDTENHIVHPFLTGYLQNTIKMYTGIEIEIVDIKSADTVDNKIMFKSVPKSLGSDGKPTYKGGFKAYSEGDSLIFESEYDNVFAQEVELFVDKYITSKSGNVTIPLPIAYSKDVGVVKYSSFGAVGDGVAEDYSALLRAHEYANQGGQKVVADGAAYYIGMTGQQIPIKTDVEWGNAKFIIDDCASGVNRKNNIFIVSRQYAKVSTSGAFLKEQGIVSDISLNRDETTSIPWLKDYIDAVSLVKIYDKGQVDYVRYGANSDSGIARCEMLEMDADGNLSENTPLAFDYKEVSLVEIYRADDDPITISGGIFETICYKTACTHTAAEGCYKGRTGPNGNTERYCRSNVYNSVRRGIAIERNNVTLRDIDHKILNEPADGSAPYYGFINVAYSNNVSLINCNLQGHKRYVEYKSNAQGKYNWVSMGTYDFIVEYSNRIYVENMTQNNGQNDIADEGYWGLMSSNGAKNFHFKSCVISRIDAHRGFWNMLVEDSVIGYTFNVIGGGELVIKNTQRRCGQSFLSLRGDYGATFDGNVTFSGCYLDAIRSYDTVWGGASGRPQTRYSDAFIIESGYSTATAYRKWDFGYTCYLPRTVTIENFSVPNSTTVYVYNQIGDSAFTPYSSGYKAYQRTEKISFVVNNTIEKPEFLTSSGRTIKSSFQVAPVGANTLRETPTEKKTVK